MRVRPGIFAATVGKQALDCWKLSLPQQKAELCPQVGAGARGEGAENRANTERSRTNSWCHVCAPRFSYAGTTPCLF